MSGLTHEHRNGRTFSVRQWREGRADNVAASMSSYKLGGSHEAAEDHCAGSFRVAFGFSVSSTQPGGGGEVRGKRVSGHSSRPPRDHQPHP